LGDQSPRGLKKGPEKKRDEAKKRLPVLAGEKLAAPARGKERDFGLLTGQEQKEKPEPKKGSDDPVWGPGTRR